MAKKVIYSDIDLKFIAHPITGLVMSKTNTDAIKQAIVNLIMTNKYELLFKPNIGADIRRLLFSLNPSSAKTVIRNSVEDILNIYEPRATLNDVIIYDYTDNNQIGIDIIFTPENALEAITINLFLERVR